MTTFDGARFMLGKYLGHKKSHGNEGDDIFRHLPVSASCIIMTVKISCLFLVLFSLPQV